MLAGMYRFVSDRSRSKRSPVGKSRVRLWGVSFLMVCASYSLVPGVANAADTSSKPVKLTFTGYAVQSIYGTFIETLMAVLREEYPDWSVTGMPSNPAGGLGLVANGGADIGLGGSAEFRAALAGEPPFTESLKGKLDWLAYMNDDIIYYFIATKAWAQKEGIRDLADIGIKKPKMAMSVNRKSNMLTVGPVMDLLGQHGITEETIQKAGGVVQWVPAGDGVGLLADGKLDLFASVAFAHSSALEDVAKRRELVWLAPEADKLARVEASWLYEPAVIKKGSYTFADRDIPTMKGWLAFVTRPDLDPGTVEKMLVAWMKHGERVEALGPGFANFRQILSKYPSEFQETLPMHPGAKVFFKSQGAGR